MDQDQRHKCKFCRKTFPCGRSLGGHMRSHLALIEEEKLGRGSQGFGPSNGYGLRENPKKTWRISDYSSDEKEKQCRECGREFQSWKALFGHMRCHSEKKTVHQEEEEEEGSWSGAYNEVRVPKRKRGPRRSASIVGSSSSSVSEYYEKDQEDVAISLMLLSRDFGYWGNGVSGFNPATESSDKNSVVLENRDEFEYKKQKGYFSDAELCLENESSSSSKKRRRTGLDDESGKSRFECTTCNKSFHSYQALGGHRASHKRMKGLCFTDDASIDRMVAGDEDGGKAKGGHQCAICGKVFASGQALGGHKRSHFVISSPSIVIEEEEEEVKVEEEAVVMPDLLDLNLPAPIDKGSSNGKVFDTWWTGSNLKSEAMIGMVSNR